MIDSLRPARCDARHPARAWLTANAAAAALVCAAWPAGAPAQSGLAETGYPEYASPAEIPLETFARNPNILSVRMSPDGQRAVAYYAVGNRVVLRIMPSIESSAEDEVKMLLRPGELRRTEWIDNNTVIVEARQSYVDSTEAPALQTLHAIKSYSIDTDRTERLVIFDDEKSGGQVVNPIVHPLPGSPDVCLLAYSPDGGPYPGVYRMNVRNGKAKVVVPPRPPITGWYADAAGIVRFGSGFDGENLVTVVRTEKEKEWRTLENDALLEGGQLQAVSLSPDGKSLVVRSAQNQGRFGLYRLSLDTGRVIEKIFEHPTVDVGAVTTSQVDGRLLSADFIVHRVEHLYFDDRIDAKMAAIDRAFPDRSASILQTSIDDRYLLLFLSSDVYPGAYYRFDMLTNNLMLIDEVRLDVNPAQMSPMLPRTYFARDGLEISGYLTIPRGTEPEGLPVVVIPHATVLDRVFVRFDPLVQFLASRGIAVFEPNYRGSVGYGFAFSGLAQSGWGLEMQDDLADAAEFLLEEGIAAPGKICLMGQNYGGYAALMGVIDDPDLFACAIAVSPITDLVKYAGVLGSSYGDEFASFVRGTRDTVELRDVSPAHRAGDIERPLLIVHGTEDEQVPYRYSLLLAARLEEQDLEFDSLALKGEGNAIATPSARVLMLTRVIEFLQEHLGLAGSDMAAGDD